LASDGDPSDGKTASAVPLSVLGQCFESTRHY
jgi:hypothetical protein